MKLDLDAPQFVRVTRLCDHLQLIHPVAAVTAHGLVDRFLLRHALRRPDLWNSQATLGEHHASDFQLMKLGYPSPSLRAGQRRNVPADQASYATLAPGDTLDSRFLLIAEINRGGMATVFKAEDQLRQREPVAIKVPNAKYASGIGAWSRFEREAEIGAKLDHPGVLKFIPVAGAERGSYVVTEFLTGTTLAERVGKGKRLPEPEALRIASQVADALHYLHENGVVHGDIKPGNVMLCNDGAIRLIDFGMAQPVKSRRFHFGGSAPVMGTVDYIAPEQLEHKNGRPSSDIYSLGAMLYEILTGSAPFPGDDPFVIGSQRLTGDPVAPRRLNPALSPQVEEIVLRALRRDPAERYPTAAALKHDLDAPLFVRVTGLCDALQSSTRGRRAWRVIRWLGFHCVLPFVVLMLLYLFIWLHFSGNH